MGPSDPFAGVSAPPPAPPPAGGGGVSLGAPMPAGAQAAGAQAAGAQAAGAGRTRVQAQSPQVPTSARASASAVGAGVGLVFGLVTIVAGLGPALVVLAFALVGAAVGALARLAGEGGLDLPGAWRALRRRP